MELLCPECLGPLVTRDGRTATCTLHGGEYRILFLRGQLVAPPASRPPIMSTPPVAAAPVQVLGVAADDSEMDEAAIGLLLALAYPDRIAQRRSEGEGRYLLANGRGARLLPGCAGGPPLLVAASLDGKGDEGRIFLAAALDADDLARYFGEKLAWQSVERWERQTQTVLAREEHRLGALVLAQRPLPAGSARQATVLAGSLAFPSRWLWPGSPRRRRAARRSAVHSTPCR